MKVIKNCKECNNQFISYDVGVRIKNVFCSLACKNNSLRVIKVERINKSCPFCKKEFVTLPSNKKKYCNKSCGNSARRFSIKLNSQEFMILLKNKYNKFVIKKDNCFGWGGAKQKGYGCFTFNGKIVSAHRASWILNMGNIPPKMHILHSCDNKECSNIEHLFIGNHKDNMLDMRNKGYYRQHAKLSKENVAEIKELLKTNIKQRDIAKKFNVDETTIHDIKFKKTWKSIEGI